MSDSPTAALASVIETLERRVWDALITGDVAADRELLASDFVGLYPTGFADRGDHVDRLADGPTVAEYRLSQIRIIELGCERVLFCYRADYRPVSGSGPGPIEAMFVSSLWCRRGGRWLNVFSQDTPVGGAVV